ncbi:hypothetical protein [Nostoc sp. LPT]|uniref:hypothetical protein n=1 Tax=Nostoc sp. LPT TaxID=2815387 RepID=UPI001DDD01E2|nr:hypothetical protein [Nostoc sp. LPT]MBN4004763.1 hypothetical protein [Nostoc sp. LPT]
MTEKGKYVTRKKRIRQLETEIEQLKDQVKTLTQLLDDAHGMILSFPSWLGAWN